MRVGPKSKDKAPYKKRKIWAKTETHTGDAMGPQRQRWEWCTYKPRDKDYWQTNIRSWKSFQRAQCY